MPKLAVVRLQFSARQCQKKSLFKLMHSVSLSFLFESLMEIFYKIAQLRQILALIFNWCEHGHLNLDVCGLSTGTLSFGEQYPELDFFRDSKLSGVHCLL